MAAQKTKQEIVAMNGDEAVAFAVKQCDVDVVAAYPITPQTIIVEKFSEYVANGEVQTQYVCTESEHSAMTACIAAAATGARTFTASASAGLALMHEMLFVASGSRVPIVMAVANRALSAPLNIHGDQSDSMAERDSGWIQIYAENAQEAYDSIIQAFKIAEDLNISLPVIVGIDGFTISHTLERVDVLSEETVKGYVGQRQYPLVLTHEGKTVPFKLDPANPMTMGPNALPELLLRIQTPTRRSHESCPKEDSRSQQLNTLSSAAEATATDLIDAYKLDDAEVAIVVIGSTAGTLKVIVDELREEGIKAGVLRIRSFRPFPAEDIRDALKNMKAVAVMDKSMSPGGLGAAVYNEVRNALYDAKQRPIMVNYIFGLGGRDSSPRDLRKIYEDLLRMAKTGQAEKQVNYLGLRE